MSSQRGNAKRTRAQKHKNTHAFKNTLHDTSKKTQEIISVQAVGCCARCKDIIDWKIKYKKYKPLTVVKKCTGCQEKRIKRAYYILCDECIKTSKKCGKCGQKKEQMLDVTPSAAEIHSSQAQLEQELKMLPERKRRTFYRLQESGQLASLGAEGEQEDEDEDADSCEDEEEEDCGDTVAGGEEEEEEVEEDGGTAVGSSLSKLEVTETSDKKVHFSDKEGVTNDS